MSNRSNKAHKGRLYAELLAQGWTLDALATQYGIKPSSVRRALNIYRQYQPAYIPPADQPADNLREIYRAYLGTSLDMADQVADAPDLPLRKIVAVGDLHGAPAASMLAAVIRREPDIVVIGGDLTNQAQASPHAPTPSRQTQQATLREELARVRAYFETLLTRLPDHTVIRVMRGNHDDWAYKQAAELLPPYLLEFFTDPLDVLFAELPVSRVERAESCYTVNGELFGESQYLYVMGDALFSHMNFTAGVEGGAVRKLHQWLYDKGWADYLGIPKLRVLCQFHGHKIAHLRPHGGLMHWIEPGMACDPAVEHYKAEYKTSWSPGALGGLYLEQQRSPETAGRWITTKVQLIDPC